MNRLENFLKYKYILLAIMILTIFIVGLLLATFRITALSTFFPPTKS